MGAVGDVMEIKGNLEEEIVGKETESVTGRVGKEIMGKKVEEVTKIIKKLEKVAKRIKRTKKRTKMKKRIDLAVGDVMEIKGNLEEEIVGKETESLLEEEMGREPERVTGRVGK